MNLDAFVCLLRVGIALSDTSDAVIGQRSTNLLGCQQPSPELGSDPNSRLGLGFKFGHHAHNARHGKAIQVFAVKSAAKVGIIRGSEKISELGTPDPYE